MASLTRYLPKGSWFHEYLACYEKQVESPQSFVLFSAMALMGAVLGRRVWMDYDIHKIRPMLNLLILGPSGIGKSTSVKMTKPLLKGIEVAYRPQFIEGGATKEKLHTDLMENPKAIIFASELAAFFSKETYKEGLIPYVTQMLDYEDQIELRTRKNGLEIVQNPEVCIIGASTREWLQDMLPDSAVSGGFLARFLLLMESRRSRRIPNPHRHMNAWNRKELEERRRKSAEEFVSLILKAFHSATSPIDYADHEAADAYELWYMGYNPATGLLSPFAARAGEMILRISIILAVSCGRYEITAEDISCAIGLYTYTAERLGEIVTPVSAAGKILSTVLETIPSEGISRQGIYKALRTVATAQEIAKALVSLVMAGEIYEQDKLVQRRQATPGVNPL